MIWSEILRLSVLGSERSHLPDLLKEKFEKEGINTDADFVEILLESAALFNQVKKAAFPLPIYKGELPEVVKEEEGTTCSALSVSHLQSILKGRYAPALAEFIICLSKNKKKLPAVKLPDLFNVSLKNERLWQLLQPVIGQKGEWLLQQIPTWEKLTHKVDVSKWKTGTITERSKVLQYWRKCEPNIAIAALEKIWANETPKDKHTFLKILFTNSSIADEHFLEERLADKQKKIRLEAALLLSKIGESALVERLFTQILTCLNLTDSTIEFELPEELPDLTKDGIFPVPQKGIRGGMKAAWLRQVIAKIPPQKWAELLDREAMECLPFFENSKWADQIFLALAEAAWWHNDETWQIAILLDLHQKGNRFDIPVLTLKKNIAALSAEAFDQLSETCFKTTPRIIENKSIFYLLLVESSHSWTDSLVLKIIHNFQYWMKNTTDDFLSTSHYRQLFEVAAYATHPHLIEKLKIGWPTKSTVWYYWEDAIEKFVRTIAFRKEMRRTLEE